MTVISRPVLVAMMGILVVALAVAAWSARPFTSQAQDVEHSYSIPLMARDGGVGTFFYTVESGDTLFSIAQRFDTTVDALVAQNQISNPNELRAGAHIMIPEPTGHTGPSARVDNGPRGTGLIALTFDMGGRVEPALPIMNWLIDNEVRATIFITGSIIESPNTSAGRQVLQLVEDHPHLFDLGNHSYSHPDFTELTETQMIDEIATTDDAIAANIDVDPRPIFRPPFGAVDQRVLDGIGEAGYAYTIMWDIDTIDWLPVADGGPTTQEMINKVVNQAQGGSIVLMHLGGFNTLDALPGMIAGLEAKGLEFTTVSDMLGE